MNLIKRYPFVFFVVLTYIISWALWTPLVISPRDSRMFLILGTFGPTLSALLLTLISNGRADLRALLGRLFIWRISIFWYLISFLVPRYRAVGDWFAHLTRRRCPGIQEFCTMVSGDPCFSLCALLQCTWGRDRLAGICLTKTASQLQCTDGESDH